MTPAEFVGLRRRCIDLVKHAIATEHGREMLKIFEHTAVMTELLPFTTTVANTFMGIVGFWNYLQQEGQKLEYFAREATHDLNECVNHSDKEWLAPRTESYIEFYVPLLVDTTPVNIVTCFFMYMWNRWCEEECRQVFGGLCQHLWSKWCYHCKRFSAGAAECFYAELDIGNQRLLVERACEYYDKNFRNHK
jgi:hypothetical protein